MEKRKPDWLKIKIQDPKQLGHMKALLNQLSLHTVCQEANCPNKMECFNKGTATFMILGNVCTRNCSFCNVTEGSPSPLDFDEPKRVAEAVKTMNLKHSVITSVTRDDLEDGGSKIFALCIDEIKKTSPDTTIEVLIPDFKGNIESLKTVLASKPNILNHNVETIPRLYPKARPKADYKQSLDLLNNSKMINPNIYTKSGIMVGIGEQEDEIFSLFEDLRKVNCDILTIGQYLAPSSKHMPVEEYIHPSVFENYKNKAYSMGFLYVASGPFVRSSYYAENFNARSRENL